MPNRFVKFFISFIIYGVCLLPALIIPTLLISLFRFLGLYNDIFETITIITSLFVTSFFSVFAGTRILTNLFQNKGLEHIFPAILVNALLIVKLIWGSSYLSDYGFFIVFIYSTIVIILVVFVYSAIKLADKNFKLWPTFELKVKFYLSRLNFIGLSVIYFLLSSFLFLATTGGWGGVIVFLIFVPAYMFLALYELILVAIFRSKHETNYKGLPITKSTIIWLARLFLLQLAALLTNTGDCSDGSGSYNYFQRLQGGLSCDNNPNTAVSYNVVILIQATYFFFLFAVITKIFIDLKQLEGKKT